MTLLLDLTFIPKIHKLVTDQRLEETQTQPSQKETLLISEATGSTIQYT